MTELVSYRLDAAIATITLDDGKVNALSIPMLRAVHGALDQAEADEAVVVLSGRERYFSAGFDLKVFAAGGEAVLEMLTLGARLSERLLAFPRPVVLACTGHAVAAGSFALLAADVRIGVDGPFQIGLNEVRIGLTVPWFAIELARQRIHRTEFVRAVANARMYGPHDALSVGFLDQLVDAEQALDSAHQIAGELATLDRAAYTATKLRVRAQAIRAIGLAIESELTLEGLSSAQR